MDGHLRYSGRTDAEQRAALTAIIRNTPFLMEVLAGLRAARLPEGLLVSGAIYNSVWNALTGRPPQNGIADIDLIYFDESDLSYEGEDKVIRAMDARFAHLPLPVQVRNQARVHLWFEKRFGQAVPPLRSAAESLGRYASTTHAVAVRLEDDDTLTLLAPFGLEPLFAFRVEPNPVLDNRAAHDAKGVRAKRIWPELTVLPWPN